MEKRCKCHQCDAIELRYYRVLLSSGISIPQSTTRGCFLLAQIIIGDCDFTSAMLKANKRAFRPLNLGGKSGKHQCRIFGQLSLSKCLPIYKLIYFCSCLLTKMNIIELKNTNKDSLFISVNETPSCMWSQRCYSNGLQSLHSLSTAVSQLFP